MTNRATRRHPRKSRDRRVWVFSGLNRDLQPEQIAKILTAAGLEQARREVEAQNAIHQEAIAEAAAREEASDD